MHGLLKVALLVAVVALLPAAVSADLYRWTDKDGVVHISDTLHKVPEDKRPTVEVIKTGPREEPAEPYIPEEAAAPVEEGPELYGDETLEWWLNTFRKVLKEIQSIESGMEAKRQYIEVFEGGRRFGQIYGREEVERYEAFKAEISEDAERLDELKEELEELRRRARIHGVPKEVRGE